MVLIVVAIPLIMGSSIPVEDIHRNDTITVTATCYNATVAQCNDDPTTTAFGYRINLNRPFSHKYIAISRDLEEYFSPGDTVIVRGTFVYDGYWIVADRMNVRWERKIDFLVREGQHTDLYRNVTIRRL